MSILYEHKYTKDKVQSTQFCYFVKQQLCGSFWGRTCKFHAGSKHFPNQFLKKKMEESFTSLSTVLATPGSNNLVPSDWKLFAST